MKTRTTTAILFLAAATLPVAGFMLGSRWSKDTAVGTIARGKYLVTCGGCGDCHTPLKMTEKGPAPDFSRLLSGQPQETKLPSPDLKPGPWFVETAGMTAWAGPWGISYAANLTPDTDTGIGAWTEDMFVKAMRTGRHMGAGREILPPMPWQNIGGLTDEDLKAIFAYLRTVPPIRNRVPLPVGPHGEQGSFE